MEKIVKETFIPDDDGEVKKVDKVIKDMVIDEENDGPKERGSIHYFDNEDNKKEE